MKKFLFFSLIFSSLPTALAHEIWFVKNVPLNTPKSLLFTSWTPTTMVMVFCAVFGLAAATVLHRILLGSPWAHTFRTRLAAWKDWVSSVIRSLTGLYLFIAAFSGFIFAPELASALLPQAVELLIGLGLVMGVFPRLIGFLGLLLYVVTLPLFPFPSSWGYIGLAGIFLYLIIVGDPRLPKIPGLAVPPKLFASLQLNRLQPYAQAILRISIGISFILVGWYFKIYQPIYALTFLRDHPVNFMPAIGFGEFTNEMFVLAAGLIEVFIGVLLTAGILTRLIGFVLIFLFTLTLELFGLYELVGHLPLYAAAFAFLVNGGGEKWSWERRERM